MDTSAFIWQYLGATGTFKGPKSNDSNKSTWPLQFSRLGKTKKTKLTKLKISQAKIPAVK